MLTPSVLLSLVFCLVASQEESGHYAWTFLSNELRWNFTQVDPSCRSANGLNPCEDVRTCRHAAASIALQGWPAHCGMVGKGIPKICCGLPLVLGEDLMKKIQAEKSRNRICGRTTIQLNASATEMKYFQILESLPELKVDKPNNFNPPLDLSTTPMLIPPVSYPRPRQEEFPWMVAIFEGNSFLCGGSLIDRIHILTSAHCFANEMEVSEITRLVVYIGDIELDGGVPFQVSKIKIHEDFVAKESRNDLAILTLKKEILIPSIAHVCLPDGEDHTNEKLAGKQITTLGWHGKEDGKPGLSLNVSEDASLLSNKECCRLYRQMGEKKMVHGITKKIICAGFHNGNSTCKVDIGGALLYKNNIYNLPSYHSDISWVLLGIISYPYACVESGYPRVYTGIWSHLDWIKRNTA